MFSNIVLSVTVRLLRSLLWLARDIALSASSSSSSEISSGIVSSESSQLVWVHRLGLINEGDDRGKVVSLEVSGCVIEVGPAVEDGSEIKVGGCAIEAGLGSDEMCPSETVEMNKSSPALLRASRRMRRQWALNLEVVIFTPLNFPSASIPPFAKHLASQVQYMYPVLEGIVTA